MILHITEKTMPAKKATMKKETKKSPVKKTSKTQVVIDDYESDVDYTTIDPPESNHELNVELLEQVENLSKKLEAASKIHQEFVCTFAELKEFSESSIKDIDVKIKKKDEECYTKYNKMSKDYSQKVYNLRSDYEKKKYELETNYDHKKDSMEREFLCDEYNKAVDVLDKKNEIAVKENDYDDLKDELEDLKKNQEKKEGDLRKEVETSSRKEVEARLKIKELEFKAQTAEMKARIEQQIKEIANLSETIGTLKVEISEQRILTRNVAEATQGAVTQNFTK